MIQRMEMWMRRISRATSSRSDAMKQMSVFPFRALAKHRNRVRIGSGKHGWSTVEFEVQSGSSQGGRSTPFSLQSSVSVATRNISCDRLASSCPWLVDYVLWSTPVVKRSLFHPTVHTVRRLFSGTRQRLSAGPRLPIPATVLAHGRTPN